MKKTTITFQVTIKILNENPIETPTQINEKEVLIGINQCLECLGEDLLNGDSIQSEGYVGCEKVKNLTITNQ